MNTCPGPSGFNTRPTSRRAFLQRAGSGFGMVALTSLLNRQGLLGADAGSEVTELVSSASFR
jgi:hypothetical protein